MSSRPRPLTHVDFHALKANASSDVTAKGSGGQPRRSPSQADHPHSEDAASKLSTKRYRSPKDDDDDAGKTKMPKLSSIRESGTSALRDFIARKESPWEIHEKVCDLDLNGPVTVAQRKAPLFGLVAVRAFPAAAAERALYMYGRVRHANVVEALDAFTTETSFYIVLEHLPISLEQIVDGAKYPTEWQLAAILRQVGSSSTGAGRTYIKHGRSSTAWPILRARG
jgi:hypothetical protein